ncbi:hypothetical protein Acsp06_54040 [Actinomycetospora sp. NBRC 106375]|nr:hypothetical protein Acsp06_54040 [Actinomycetospora sp. NBRC 106375]
MEPRRAAQVLSEPWGTIVAMAIDTQWATEVLEHFLGLAELYRPPDPPGMTIIGPSLSNRGTQADITSEAAVVEQILDRTLPGWRQNVEHEPKVNRWYQHLEASRRALAVIRRQPEIDAALGDDAPRLSASSLHPWVWDGARSLWQSGHFREAVGAAARKLNAETQNKLGRQDISETDLFNQAFNTEAPKPGTPRLRLMKDEDSKTFSSVHRGARALAEACYAGIRNPISHLEGELPEALALEQLATFSVLARWVDGAEVLTI